MKLSQLLFQLKELSEELDNDPEVVFELREELNRLTIHGTALSIDKCEPVVVLL